MPLGVDGSVAGILERDLKSFGEALRIQRPRRRGVRPGTGRRVRQPGGRRNRCLLRGQQVRGVGQSSWGPAVFAVVADSEQADLIADQLRRRFGLPQASVWTTHACNHGTH